jgi:competence protein ComEC
VAKRFTYLINVLKRSYRILLVIGFIYGIVIAEEFKIAYLVEVLSISSIIFLIAKPKIGFIVLIILLGVLRVMLANRIGVDHIANYLGEEAEITATVVSYPQLRNQEQVLILKPTSIKLEDHMLSVRSGYLQLRLSKYIKINKGDQLKLLANIEEPENFEDFDYVGHLKSQNIYALVKNPKDLSVSNTRSKFEVFIGKIRQRIVLDINKSFPDPHAKLLTGMLIGTREQFSLEFANKLSITSTSHVIAVSGYNISLVSSSILRLSGYFHRKLLICVSFICLGLFLTLVGLDNLPALRAGLMGFIMLGAMLTGRRGAGVPMLFLIAGFMHLHNPFIYKSLSFQLSFSATLGLMIMSSKLKHLLEGIIRNRVNLEEVSTTLSALIVTFPVTFLNFGKVTIYGLIANILIAPLVVFITFSGIAFLVVNTLSTDLAFVIKAFLWGLLETMIRIIDVFAEFPYSDLGLDENLLLVSLIAILLIMVFIFELNFREYSKKVD